MIHLFGAIEIGAVPRRISMAKATSLCGGKTGESSGNTSGKSLSIGISSNVGLSLSVSTIWANYASQPSIINRLASMADITQTGTT